MREFLRPVRRKFGLIMLVMACVLMAGWARSQSIDDSYFVSHNSWTRLIESRSGSIRWTTFDFPGVTNDDGTKFGSVPVRESDPVEFVLRKYAPVTRMSFLGLSFSEGNFFSISTVKRWVIPYSLIALPLTLLSAWLLIRKGRKRFTQQFESPGLDGFRRPRSQTNI